MSLLICGRRIDEKSAGAAILGGVVSKAIDRNSLANSRRASVLSLSLPLLLSIGIDGIIVPLPRSPSPTNITTILLTLQHHLADRVAPRVLDALQERPGDVAVHERQPLVAEDFLAGLVLGRQLRFGAQALGLLGGGGGASCVRDGGDRSSSSTSGGGDWSSGGVVSDGGSRGSARSDGSSSVRSIGLDRRSLPRRGGLIARVGTGKDRLGRRSARDEQHGCREEQHARAHGRHRFKRVPRRRCRGN